MSIQVQGVTIVNASRQLSNITNLRTVGGQSILGTGDISANGSRAIVDYVISGNPASGSGGDEIWSFTFSPDYVAADTTSGFSVSSTSLPSNQQWTSLEYGDGTWVAVAKNTSTYAYSSDGVVWTESSFPITNSWNSVMYANGRWVVCPDGGSSSSWLVTSTNPVSGWQLSNFGGNGKTKTNLIYDGYYWWTGWSTSVSPNIEYFLYSSNGTTWSITNPDNPPNYGWSNRIFYDSTYDYSLALTSRYIDGTSFFSNIFYYKVGNVSWIRSSGGTQGGHSARFIKRGQKLFYTSYQVQLGPTGWQIRMYNITFSSGFVTLSESSNYLSLTSFLTSGEQVTAFEYLDNKFVILTDSNKLFYCISADGLTPSVFTATNWVMVQLTTSTNWTNIVYGAADNKSVAISSAVGTNYAQVFTGSPIETRYDLSLPAHGVYSTVTNLVVSPPMGATPTQQANLLGNTILASRPAYTVTYPSAGQVQVDTNSGGNISDPILTMTAPPTSGSLNLVVNQGGGTAQQDVITVTDLGNGQTFIYTGDLYSTVDYISNSLAYYNTLTNWQMLPPISISTSSKLTLLAVNNGYVTTATMPTIQVTTTGSNSTLSVTRSIRSFGN